MVLPCAGKNWTKTSGWTTPCADTFPARNKTGRTHSNNNGEAAAVEVRGISRHENGGDQKSFCVGLHRLLARMESAERSWFAILHLQFSILVLHTFSTVDLPSSPAGLNSRIKIKIANAMPSR